MKIAIIGYGKMGMEVEKLALSRDHEISLKIDVNNLPYSPEDLKDVDVAIEFSTPESAVSNISIAFEANTPIVVGTTGWLDQLENVRSMCNDQQQALFYAPNFSIGVNIFMEINKRLAGLMNDQSSYKASMEEVHHTEKLDSPSGTAVKLAEDMISQINKLQNWTNMEATDDGELSIISKRIENVPGTHTIKYSSDVDTIEIRHEAHSRVGFATGAVLAAEWIVGKQGVFTMSDLLKS
ncbi:4-hydroxy-tetrahydrodipicolinate reductase [bacterium AH-315-C07]|nr:4-hydroxy-tetrahydrodipicolinate reductase [bacterium AH-315-C07]